MRYDGKRRRRRAGIKGCCTMCSYRSTDGRRNGRVLTKQELAAELSYQEQLEEVDDWVDSFYDVYMLEPMTPSLH
jgi:hypothetical protein